jgi:hypothetical protein
MADELEGTWQEVIVAWKRYYPSICLEGLRKSTKKTVRTAEIQGTSWIQQYSYELSCLASTCWIRNVQYNNITGFIVFYSSPLVRYYWIHGPINMFWTHLQTFMKSNMIKTIHVTGHVSPQGCETRLLHFLNNRFTDDVSLMHQPTVLYPTGRFLVLISVRGWVHPGAAVRLEALNELNNPMASGIKPPSFVL